MLVVSEVSVWRYGAECEKRGWVSQSNISRRVPGAGSSRLSGFSGLFSLFSWFAARNRPDKLDRLPLNLPSHNAPTIQQSSFDACQRHGPTRPEKVECPGSLIN